MKYLDVYERFEEVCPRVTVGDYNEKELRLAVITGFKIIGYPPKDLDYSIILALQRHTESTLLYEFLYTVYEVDNEV